jgi:AcrR family transcriptional regulator
MPSQMTGSIPPFAAAAAAPAKPLRADARRNRARVIEAARECFARDGIEAQMDEVAAAAGVGVGTVYRHFATKDALVDALAADYFAGEEEIARRSLDVDDPWEAFSGFIREGAELLEANRALAQISADRPEVMKQAAVAADQELGFFGTVETLIERAKHAGVLREDFELEDVPAIMCSLGALQTSRGAYANWRRVLEMVLDGCRAKLCSELPPVGATLPRARQ